MGFVTRRRRQLVAKKSKTSISKKAQLLIDEHQLDVKELTPNSKGKITVKEVKKYLAIPKEIADNSSDDSIGKPENEGAINIGADPAVQVDESIATGAAAEEG